MRCSISGKVQGVWFRASAKEQAEQLQIRGWARNVSDGSVEVFACGTESQLELFYSWLQHGPRLARVDDHSVKIYYGRIMRGLMFARFLPGY